MVILSLRRVIETLGELNIIRQTNAPKQCFTKYIAVNSVRHTTYFTIIKQKSNELLTILVTTLFCGSCESCHCFDFILSYMYIFLGFLARPYIFYAGSIWEGTHDTKFERFPPSEVCVGGGGGWILTAGETWERSVLTSRHSLIFLQVQVLLQTLSNF